MVKLQEPTSPVYESAGDYFFVLDFNSELGLYSLAIRFDKNNNFIVNDVSKNDLENLREMLNKVLGFEKIKLN